MSSLCPGAQSILHIPRKLRFPQRTEKINMKSDMQLEQDVLEELKWDQRPRCGCIVRDLTRTRDSFPE